MNDKGEEELPIFKEYDFDFNKGEFVYDNLNRRKIVEENEALKIWIQKALMTERFSYLAYSWQYGIELEPFIGKVMSIKERESELRRVIKECIMVNPYILSIDNIKFKYEDRQRILHVHIFLTTIYGKADLYV